MIPTVALNDGTDLPAIGFGTYRLNGEGGVAPAVDRHPLRYEDW